MSADATNEPAVPALVTARQRRYIIGLLTLIYTLAYLDRQIVNILAESIRRELHLADWQIGALSGLAFALLYTTLGIPAARLSERWNRSWIVAGSLVVWSGFTALSGMANNFIHLVLARTGVGIGEAGCIPASHSLISEITPRERRASALAVFSMGLPLGSLIGLALGGLMASTWGWRSAFFIVGLPGVVLAIVMLVTVRDPRTARSAERTAGPADVPTLREAFDHLRRRRSFAWMTAGAALLGLTGYAHQAFYGSFFLRNHAASLDAAAQATGLGSGLAFLGIALGLIVGISGTFGAGLGGRLGDRFAAVDPAGYMRVPMISTLLAVPFLIAAFLASNVTVALTLLVVPHFLKSMWYGPVFAAVQGLVQPRSRATAIALFLLIVNAVGLGLGPIAMGALSDALARVLGPNEGLRMAMVILSVAVAASGFCFHRAGQTLGDDMVS